jgi:hypothetical protein
MSKAIKTGVQCLSSEQQHLQELIISQQRNDGSWDSFKEFDDLIQSTALSVNLLFNLYRGSEKEQQAIKRGVQFLLSQVKRSNGQAYWPGGIYFSGGTFSRKRIVWKSDAYTTALILEILTKYKKQFL